MGAHSTVKERQPIINHHKDGKSIRQIAEMVNKSHSTIQHIIERFRKNKTVQKKIRVSPKHFFTIADERWIVNQVKKKPRISAPKLTSEIQKYLNKTVNPETVRIVLRKYKFHGRVARKKPFIGKTNKKIRVEFAEEHSKKNTTFWNRVLFTDESKLFSEGMVDIQLSKSLENPTTIT